MADDEVQSFARHQEIIRNGKARVALSDAAPIIGFLSGKVHGSSLHIWQISVHFDHQKRGMGGGLMLTARSWAIANKLASLALTTFRDVPWNPAF
ncbi:MAG: GNAT family N-acetyltransferase [Sphingomonadales bacterium]|nr:GNAT family N-acetyltransferase [Sphingomonadales bacterium]